MLVTFVRTELDGNQSRTGAPVRMNWAPLCYCRAMGIRLLARTTRNVALTEAGEQLRESLAPRIDEIEADIAALMSFRDKPSGTIRITL